MEPCKFKLPRGKMFKPVGLELANSEFLKKWGQGKSDLDQVTGGLELTKLELAALYCL